jgi:hypothetical protein
MTPTRVEGAGRALRTPTPLQGRAAASPPPPVELEAWPIVLACAVLAPARAEELLEGLAQADVEEAHRLLRSFQEQDSATRQVRLSVEFGIRLNADERLRLLMAEAPPPLQQAILQRLPSYQRTLFPGLEASTAEPLLPHLEALAERLVKEATR